MLKGTSWTAHKVTKKSKTEREKNYYVIFDGNAWTTFKIQLLSDTEQVQPAPIYWWYISKFHKFAKETVAERYWTLNVKVIGAVTNHIRIQIQVYQLGPIYCNISRPAERDIWPPDTCNAVKPQVKWVECWCYLWKYTWHLVGEDLMQAYVGLEPPCAWNADNRIKLNFSYF